MVGCLNQMKPPRSLRAFLRHSLQVNLYLLIKLKPLSSPSRVDSVRGPLVCFYENPVAKLKKFLIFFLIARDDSRDTSNFCGGSLYTRPYSPKDILPASPSACLICRSDIFFRRSTASISFIIFGPLQASFLATYFLNRSLKKSSRDLSVFP